MTPHPTRPLFLTVLAGVLAAGVALVPAAPAAADTSDFTFDSFTADYYLGVDDEGRSTLRVVETLVAVFPDFDQNHGLLRAIPLGYDGHPTDLEMVSVTDENGSPRPWREANEDESSGDSDFLEIVSREDGFVRGRQTYVFTYEQHNVTRFAADAREGGTDEFYRDVNGTGWAQPFGTVTARLHVDDSIAPSLTGAMACYHGVEGSTDRCDIAGPDSEGVITATAGDLGPKENVTIAVAFEPGTFVPRDSRFTSSPFWLAQTLLALLALLVSAWIVSVYRRRLRSAPGRPTIIAEYTPPRYASIASAAALLATPTKFAAAQLLDLAVRGAVRVIEVPTKGGFSRSPHYEVRLVSTEGLDDREREFLGIFFDTLTPGEEYTMSSSDTARSRRVYAAATAATSALRTGGYRATIRAGVRLWPMVAAFLVAVLLFVAGILVIADARGGVLPVLLWLPGALAVVLGLALLFRPVLTPAGAEYRDHLEGLRLYIRLAEADRLRVLQSPQGAERTPVATDDRRTVLKLYERLLPYAVLFGLEKDWAKELGEYYDGSPPDWYSGNAAFSAGLFASSIGSMTQATASSYSGTSSSSSSSGSGGGGFSGGGGGGGGGGGV